MATANKLDPKVEEIKLPSPFEPVTINIEEVLATTITRDASLESLEVYSLNWVDERLCRSRVLSPC